MGYGRISYYISGDCHGEFEKIGLFCRNYQTNPEDVLILLGDVGLNYFLNPSDKKRKNQLSELPITLLCVQGNHEERPANISSYIEKEWHGGSVFYEPEYSNILFAKDGEVYDFDGKKAIVMGGAYSIDKEFRLMAGMPWFADEQPSDEIKAYVEEKLEQCDWKVDYVLSHTCPACMVPADLFLDTDAQNKVDHSTEEWLEKLYKRLDFQKWYFGHFHENRSYIRFTMLYEEIRELGSEDFLQRLGRPKYRQGEMVLFYILEGCEEIECYGRIQHVNRYGTAGQYREVSYDIYGPDYQETERKILYEHIVESKVVQNF